MIQAIQLGDRLVAPQHPCFIIAEAGVNHNGEMDLAHRLIESAAAAGADAVKFQAFITEELVTPQAQKAGYQAVTTGQAGRQFEMLKALELSGSEQAELSEACQAAGVQYLCTPYDFPSVDMLADIGVTAFKIASTDVTNIPFLRYLAAQECPLILSTGMSTLGEVEAAFEALLQGGASGRIAILQCTAEYPAPLNEVNLRAMATMAQAFQVPVGFSDHTPGIGASPWAVAAGACLVEKHFTLDRSLSGPDHRASLEPDELAELVKTIRQVEAALGDGIKRPTPSELPNKPFMQKSLVVNRPVHKGQRFSAADLGMKRPGTGLKPQMFDQVVGQAAARDLQPGETLTLDAIAWKELKG